MNPAWQQFLAGRVVHSTTPADAAPPDSQPTLADLSHLGVIEISGADAGSFLHGQFTSDVAALPAGQTQLSAWSNAKGKVIAVILLLRMPDRFCLFLPAEQVGAFIRRLQMFVLRAAVHIADRTTEWVRIGFSSAVGQELPSALLNNALAPWQQQVRDGMTLLRLPDADGRRRVLVCGEAATLQALWLQLESQYKTVAASRWQLQDLRSGIPWLAPALTEMFLPQELSLETLGALSLAKGCYPGQEIIARVHFRGRHRRGLCRFTVTSSAPPAAATTLHVSGPEPRNAGTVLGAQTLHADIQEGLAVCELDFAGTPGWHLGSSGGPPIRIDELIK